MREKSLSASLVLVVATAAAALVVLRSRFPGNLSHTGPDDAFITYRYARNLAHGLGFVFNPGDAPVLGTSTPLYALLLAAGARLGVDIPSLSVAVGTLATAACVALMALLGIRTGLAAAGIAAALTFGASPFNGAYLEGMETPLYLALALGAILASVCRRPTLAMTLGALVVLTRLDGAAVLAVVTAHEVLVRRKVPWRSVVPGAILLGSWGLYALWRFGSVLPASGLAKMAHPFSISGRFSPASPRLMNLTFPAFDALGVLRAPAERLGFLAVVFLGLVLLARSVRPPRTFEESGAVTTGLVGAWFLLYVAGMKVLRLPDFTWYYGPPAVSLALLSWILAFALVRRIAPRLSSPSVLAAAAALSALGWWVPVESEVLREPSPHALAGRWLKEHASPSDTVCAYEIGMVGYYSDLRTIDMLGLTEPGARPHLLRADYAWAIRERRPAFVFTHEPDRWPVSDAIFAEPEFTSRYREVVRFRDPGHADYVLFRRTG